MGIGVGWELGFGLELLYGMGIGVSNGDEDQDLFGAWAPAWNWI